jgi:precorrin-6B methylase 2
MFFLLFLEILFLLFLVYVIYLLSYSLIKGAPFAPLGKKRMEAMFELLNCEKGKKLVDLGSGDGRIVIAAVKYEIKAYGFEINPLIAFVSKIKIRKLKLKNAKVYIKDYWKIDLSDFDCVTLYGTPHIMGNLEKKLLKELKPGAKVVSNHFKFPNLKVVKQLNDVYLYIF